MDGWGGGEQWAEHSAGQTAAVPARVELVRLVALTALIAPFTAGCSVEEVIRFGWPVGVTPQAEAMRHLWTWSGIAALVVGVITWGAMFWAMIFHRKRKDSDPGIRPAADAVQPARRDDLHGRARTIIVAVLFGFTVSVQNYVEIDPPNPDLKVDVTAFQWHWKFAYTGQQRRRRAADQHAGLRATRSRCWCCPRARASSSPSTPTT